MWQVEEDGLIAELAVLVWLLPKAEPQIRPGCWRLTWEVISKAQSRMWGERNKEGNEVSMVCWYLNQLVTLAHLVPQTM